MFPTSSDDAVVDAVAVVTVVLVVDVAGGVGKAAAPAPAAPVASLAPAGLMLDYNTSQASDWQPSLFFFPVASQCERLRQDLSFRLETQCLSVTPVLL